MITLDHPGSPPRAAALMTLMAARFVSTDPSPPEAGRFRLYPFIGPGTLEDCIDALVAMPKPVLCIPIPLRTPTLAVWDDSESIQRSHAEPLNVLQEVELPAGPDRPILVLGRTECLRVTRDDVAAWEATYFIEGPSVTVMATPPSPEERRSGAAHVILFVSSEGNYLRLIRPPGQ